MLYKMYFDYFFLLDLNFFYILSQTYLNLTQDKLKTSIDLEWRE